MSPPGEGLRLTELLASLSLATDLGTGQPLGHGLRTSLLAVELARTMGLAPEGVRSVQQVSLLRFVGCTADASETAQLVGGDDISFNAAMAPYMHGSPPAMVTRIFKAVAPGESLLRRASSTLTMLRESGDSGLAAHCEVAAMFAGRLGLGEEVITALQAAYERWDGKGLPSGLKGDDIPVEVRIASFAHDIDVFTRVGADIDALLDERRGKGYDPKVVDAFRKTSTRAPEADWEEVLGAEPAPTAYIEDLDTALSVLAEFSDLKSPWTRGHSRHVADLAHYAAQEAGLTTGEADVIRRAGLVHDVGRVGIENGIWDKPGQLSTDEWEKVRTHPYLTQRTLARCPQLASLGLLASSHHERLDGSGYHRQSIADHLPIEARLLAAADMMAALTSPRPHRGAFDLDEAFAVLRGEAGAGRLDSRAVECVVAAAGGEATPRERANPDGLTEREIEVLVLISSGLANRQVAEVLFISSKTVGRHIENVYAKIGVSTRAAAAVYAMGQGLLSHPARG